VPRSRVEPARQQHGAESARCHGRLVRKRRLADADAARYDQQLRMAGHHLPREFLDLLALLVAAVQLAVRAPEGLEADIALRRHVVVAVAAAAQQLDVAQHCLDGLVAVLRPLRQRLLAPALQPHAPGAQRGAPFQ
jgi:hypothetical protein